MKFCFCEIYVGKAKFHIQICNSAAPFEEDFDILCNTLLGTNVNCPVIINCQVKSIASNNLLLVCLSPSSIIFFND